MKHSWRGRRLDYISDESNIESFLYVSCPLTDWILRGSAVAADTYQTEYPMRGWERDGPSFQRSNHPSETRTSYTRFFNDRKIFFFFLHRQVFARGKSTAWLIEVCCAHIFALFLSGIYSRRGILIRGRRVGFFVMNNSAASACIHILCGVYYVMRILSAIWSWLKGLDSNFDRLNKRR